MTADAAPWPRALFAPAPAARLGGVRLLVGLYAVAFVWGFGPVLAGYAALPGGRWLPVGVASGLVSPPPVWTTWAALAVAAVTAPCFALGLRYRLTAPLFALSLGWVLTLRHSWGMVFHSENLLWFHVAVLAVAPAADAWSLDARRRVGTATPAPRGRYRWPLWLMAYVVCLAYLLAGIAKLRHGGLAWANGEALQAQVAYDNLRKLALGATPSPLGVALVPHAWIFAPLSVLTLALELGAPLALLHRRVAAIWALGMWAFHLGVLLMMFILFAYPLSGVAFAPFFRVERLLDRARGWPGVGRWLARLSGA